jgi:hypothetical protein
VDFEPIVVQESGLPSPVAPPIVRDVEDKVVVPVTGSIVAGLPALSIVPLGSDLLAAGNPQGEKVCNYKERAQCAREYLSLPASASCVRYAWMRPISDARSPISMSWFSSAVRSMISAVDLRSSLSISPETMSNTFATRIGGNHWFYRVFRLLWVLWFHVHGSDLNRELHNLHVTVFGDRRDDGVKTLLPERAHILLVVITEGLTVVDGRDTVPGHLVSLDLKSSKLTDYNSLGSHDLRQTKKCGLADKFWNLLRRGRSGT